MNYCKELEQQLAEMERELAYMEEVGSDAGISIPEMKVLENLPLITKESAEAETGAKVGTQHDININLISQQGTTVEGAAEYLVGEFPELEYSDVRDMIIEILTTGKKNFREAIIGSAKQQSAKVQAAKKEYIGACLGDMRQHELSEMARMINAMRKGEVRDLTKTEVIAAAQHFQSMRTERSQDLDKASDSKKRLTPNSVNLFRWMKSPGQFDLIGIDTDVANDATADLKISKEIFWARIGLKSKRKPAAVKQRKAKKPSKLNKELAQSTQKK